MRHVDGVHGRPTPEVSVTEFGESTVNVDVLYWHAPDQATTRRIRSAVAIAIKRALDGAGIDIPFPQRVLRFADGTAAGRGSTDATVDRRRLDSAT